MKNVLIVILNWLRTKFLSVKNAEEKSASSVSKTENAGSVEIKPLIVNPDHLILDAEQEYKLKSLAIQCLGIPYKFGAEVLDLNCEPQNIKEIDCSELIEYLFRKALGLIVPDGSYNQYNVSEEIKREEGQFGNLVFMRSKETNQICHVAIYDGAGMVYEASGWYKKVINRNLEAFAKETSHAKYAGMRCLLQSKIKTI